jgi:hypothetical protein
MILNRQQADSADRQIRCTAVAQRRKMAFFTESLLSIILSSQ